MTKVYLFNRQDYKDYPDHTLVLATMIYDSIEGCRFELECGCGGPIFDIDFNTLKKEYFYIGEF